MSLLQLNTKHRVSGPTFVQAARTAGQSVNTLNVTLTGVVAGHTLIVVLSVVGTGTVSSANDSNGGALTVGPTNPASPNTLVNQFSFYKLSAASGSHTITVNLSASHNWTLAAIEASGLTAFDTQARGTQGTTATSQTTPTLTPGGSPGFIVGQCLAYANVTSMTDPPTGFISIGTIPDTLAVCETCYKITGSGIAATWNWSGSTAESNSWLISFK